MEISAQDKHINILWDASPLWGHLVLNAVLQSGLSYQIIRAKHCIENKINGKILIVPGGSGRSKSKLLGEEGKQAIRKFVENGGIYLGLCGGAGLALSDDQGGLGLCPWGRNSYKDRIQHLISGNVLAKLADHELIPKDLRTKHCELPVWWPGRFAEPKELEKCKSPQNPLQGEVQVLARYVDMGTDLYLSDLPLKKLPSTTLEDWKNLYGVNLRPNLLNNQPCIISGSYGKGQYILSYSHLETPKAKNANYILWQILKKHLKLESQTELSFKNNTEPHFEIFAKTQAENILNAKDFNPSWLVPKSNFPLLEELSYKLEEVFLLCVELHLLFPRKSWLYGWHSSIPGSQLNALRVALMRSTHLQITEKRTSFLEEHGQELKNDINLFIQGARNWLLAKKLSLTLADNELIPEKIIQEQRLELFGQQMLGGGLCGSLLDLLDEFLFLE